MTAIASETKQQLIAVFDSMKVGRCMPPPPPDLAPSEAHALMVIAAMRVRGEELRPKRIAKALGISPSALSQTLKPLEVKGYVGRCRSQGDSRSVEVSLTEKGAAVAETGALAHDRFISDVVDYLGEEDVHDLLRIAGRINTFLEERDPATYGETCGVRANEGGGGAPDSKKPRDVTKEGGTV